MHNQEVLIDNIENELTPNLGKAFEEMVLKDNPEVTFLGETHNDDKQRVIVKELIQHSIDIGKKPNFLGIELPSTIASDLTESGRLVLEELRELIEFCLENEIIVIGIEEKLSKGMRSPIHSQPRENAIATNIIAAHEQYGSGMVLIGEWHSRKTSGIGTSDRFREIKTSANIVSDQLNTKSVLLHRMSRSDPLARRIDSVGIPMAQKGSLAWIYAPIRKVIGDFNANAEEETGVATEHDHDLTILIPSKASDINASYNAVRTETTKYLN